VALNKLQNCKFLSHRAAVAAAAATTKASTYFLELFDRFVVIYRMSVRVVNIRLNLMMFHNGTALGNGWRNITMDSIYPDAELTRIFHRVIEYAEA
jgi:hypothetical protein